MTLAYTSALTEWQWELLDYLLPPAKSTGRPRSVDLRAVVNAILYLLRTGCAWSLLPQEYPPYSTVYYYFRQWRDDGSWIRIHNRLVAWVRVSADRYPSASAASLDSQSVPTAVMVNQAVGYDAAKKLKGRKRLTLVDTLGLLLGVPVVSCQFTY